LDKASEERPDLEGSFISEFFQEDRDGTRYVFSPYIQKNAFESVIPDDGNETVVVTTWKEEEIRSGVSDPRVFEVARERDYFFKAYRPLHLKVYSWGIESAIIGSANLTGTGMGLSPESNEEYLHQVDPIPPRRRVQLYRIVENAPIVTEAEYERALEIWGEHQPPDEQEDVLQEMRVNPDFETSNLPLTEDAGDVIEAVANWSQQPLQSLDHQTRRCVLHDIAVYDLQEYSGQSRREVEAALKESFLDHPFIEALTAEMDPCIYFGEMKAWVQDRCTDVPTPSRRSLTDNVQVLYNWFPKLLPGRFEVDVPGRHSERLCKKG
jgi:hypothetical protein